MRVVLNQLLFSQTHSFNRNPAAASPRPATRVLRVQDQPHSLPQGVSMKVTLRCKLVPKRREQKGGMARRLRRGWEGRETQGRDPEDSGLAAHGQELPVCGDCLAAEDLGLGSRSAPLRAPAVASFQRGNSHPRHTGMSPGSSPSRLHSKRQASSRPFRDAQSEGYRCSKCSDDHRRIEQAARSEAGLASVL